MLPAIGLTPGGSSTLHIYTQTIRKTTQLTTIQWFCWSSSTITVLSFIEHLAVSVHTRSHPPLFAVSYIAI